MRTFGLNSKEFYEAVTPPPDTVPADGSAGSAAHTPPGQAKEADEAGAATLPPRQAKKTDE